MKLLLHVLALPVGYLLGWFLYGLAPLPLLTVVLALVMGLAYFSGGSAALLSLLKLLLGTVWLVSLVGSTLGSLMLVRAISPHFDGGAALAPLLLLMVITWVLTLIFWRRLRDLGRGVWPLPPAPLLFVAGVLAFAFFPAVRVDCRGLQQDDFLSFGSDFAFRDYWHPRWVKNPELVPDAAQLPTDFVVDHLRPSISRCFQDSRGRSRVFSFRAASPLLTVHLNEKGPSRRIYAAVFSPGDHRKLTPWMQVEPLAFENSRKETHTPYGYPAWAVYPYLKNLPDALERQLIHD